MNNEIQKFDFKGAPLRTLTDKAEESWFVAKDVCDILGTDTRDLHKILESDEITNVDSIHIAQNGGKAPLIISEPGLYRLVMKSRKPEAKEFQRWVTHEVLPSIRKHGGYMAGQERMTPEQMALASMRWLQSKVDEQAKQLKAQEGKVLFANAVETARTSILVGDFAKILKSNGIDIGHGACSPGSASMDGSSRPRAPVGTCPHRRRWTFTCSRSRRRPSATRTGTPRSTRRRRCPARGRRISPNCSSRNQHRKRVRDE